MANYECSTCDYCDKNRKQGNKVRCIRLSKYVEVLSICEEFTNKEYEEARQKVNRMIVGGSMESSIVALDGRKNG